jgi:hypothetical protein
LTLNLIEGFETTSKQANEKNAKDMPAINQSGVLDKRLKNNYFFQLALNLHHG